MNTVFKYFMILLFSPIFNSCIMPFYYPSAPPTRIMQTSDFKPGVTTKEEVILKFGASFFISLDEKTFTYTYYTDSGTYGFIWIIPGMGGTAGMVKLRSQHDIIIEFDAFDTVIECNETVGDFPKATGIKAFTGIDMLEALSHSKWQ